MLPGTQKLTSQTDLDPQGPAASYGSPQNAWLHILSSVLDRQGTEKAVSGASNPRKTVPGSKAKGDTGLPGLAAPVGKKSRHGLMPSTDTLKLEQTPARETAKTTKEMKPSGQPERPGKTFTSNRALRFLNFHAASLQPVNHRVIKQIRFKETDRPEDAAVGTKKPLPKAMRISRSQVVEILQKLTETSLKAQMTASKVANPVTLDVEGLGKMSVNVDKTNGGLAVNISVSTLQAKQWLEARLGSFRLKTKNVHIQIKRASSKNWDTGEADPALSGQKRTPSEKKANGLVKTTEDRPNPGLSVPDKSKSATGDSGRAGSETDGARNLHKSASRSQVDSTLARGFESEMLRFSATGVRKVKSVHGPDLIQRVTEITKDAVARMNQKLEVQVEVETLGKIAMDASKQHGQLHLLIRVDNEEIKRWLELQLSSLMNEMQRQGIAIDRLEIDVDQGTQKQYGDDSRFADTGNGRRFNRGQSNLGLEHGLSGTATRRHFGYNTIEVSV